MWRIGSKRVPVCALVLVHRRAQMYFVRVGVCDTPREREGAGGDEAVKGAHRDSGFYTA